MKISRNESLPHSLQLQESIAESLASIAESLKAIVEDEVK